METPFVKRALREEEKALVQHLITLIPGKEKTYEVPTAARELDDGGMGSITFDLARQRQYGRDLVQVKYTDTDDVDVIITLIADNEGDLYELELWKINFHGLKQYPSPDRVRE